MKIILIKNIETLGKVGDIVSVKNGYARNYLFPKKNAYHIDKQTANQVFFLSFFCYFS